MFHTSHIHVPQYRHHSALRTFVTSSFSSPPETKEPVRRGILFMAVAGVLLLIGSILTWLGFNDVFGGKISMTGPLLIALALLLLLLSTRQFLKARKHSRNRLQLGPVGRGTLRAVVVDHNDRLGAVTVIMDSLNVDNNQLNRGSTEDAPPSYSEVAELTNGTAIQPYSPQDHDEPPPPYDDATLSPENLLTLHLPKYESVMGRRSPVPRYEDIFHTSNLPGYVPSQHPNICHTHNLLATTAQGNASHVSCNSNQSTCMNPSSHSSSPQPSHPCMQHTCEAFCSLNGHMHSNHAFSPSSTHFSSNEGQDSTNFLVSVNQEPSSINLVSTEGQTSNSSQCRMQKLPCCRNHSPCCGQHAATSYCSHTTTTTPLCSPHSPCHCHSCSSNHLTYPCHHTNHAPPLTNENAETHCFNQLSNTQEPISISNAQSCSSVTTTKIQVIDESNYKLDDSDSAIDQSHTLISQEDLSLTTNTLGRSYGTPTQDTEHTF